MTEIITFDEDDIGCKFTKSANGVTVKITDWKRNSCCCVDGFQYKDCNIKLIKVYTCDNCYLIKNVCGSYILPKKEDFISKIEFHVFNFDNGIQFSISGPSNIILDADYGYNIVIVNTTKFDFEHALLKINIQNLKYVSITNAGPFIPFDPNHFVVPFHLPAGDFKIFHLTVRPLPNTDPYAASIKGELLTTLNNSCQAVTKVAQQLINVDLPSPLPQ